MKQFGKQEADKFCLSALVKCRQTIPGTSDNTNQT
jgi:hypothetical protein